jgi:hypothetical protein
VAVKLKPKVKVKVKMKEEVVGPSAKVRRLHAGLDGAAFPRGPRRVVGVRSVGLRASLQVATRRHFLSGSARPEETTASASESLQVSCQLSAVSCQLSTVSSPRS